LLDYDDSAALYFFGTVLLCILLPWTYSLIMGILFPVKTFLKEYPVKSSGGSVIKYCKTSFSQDRMYKAKNESTRWSNRLTVSILIQIVVVILLWYLVAQIAISLGSETQISQFDPFVILEISSGATDREIKKAYRHASLKYHPDKNPNDPLAASKFMLISKAYAALTDEVAKKNYEMYGNPDGPSAMKVGIGLPRFLVEEQYQLLILIVFFVVLLFIVPVIFIWHYQKQKKYAVNGLQVETLHFLSYYVNEATRSKNGPEFLAASAESRELQMRPTDNADIKHLMENVTEKQKRQFSVPIIVRNYFLILGHMQRLHEYITTEGLQSDLQTLLKVGLQITYSMIEIATIRDYTHTAISMLEFRRCLIQALDVKSSPLLQVPHFTEEHVRHCSRGKNAVRGLAEFISQAPEERKGLMDMDAQQLADVQAFCAHVSDVDIIPKIEVTDEDEIVVGDVATITVTMVRRNLKEGEAAGPIHAPLFPELKYEEWYVIVTDKNDGDGMVAFMRLKSPERVVEESVQVPIRKDGKHTYIVSAYCDSYAGIDRVETLNFTAHKADEVKREVVVHPEDLALDNEPTLFEQVMGQMNADDSDEEEEILDNGTAKPVARVREEAAMSDSEIDDDD